MLLIPPHMLSFIFKLSNTLSFQIDPALLQQTLQQGGLLSQPLSVDTGLVSHSGSQLMSTTDTSVSANVVIHPLTSLALQPSTITPAQVTMAGLSEQDAASMYDSYKWKKENIQSGHIVLGGNHLCCVAVGFAGSQDLSNVMGSSGLVAGGNSGQEITLTINNSSLTQALAQVQASAAGSGTAGGNPQEITLTISGRNSLICHMSIKNIKYQKYTGLLNMFFSKDRKGLLITNMGKNKPSTISIDFLTQANTRASRQRGKNEANNNSEPLHKPRSKDTLLEAIFQLLYTPSASPIWLYHLGI